MRATVRVPASVANLGPGFDMLALALQVQNEVVATATDNGAIAIELEDVGGLPELLDPDYNLVARAYIEACARLDVPASQRGVRLRCVNAIPIAAGMGSSAAATLSGVLVAVALHRAGWDERDILDCAGGFEGHADNLAAALMGGLVICAPGAAVQRVDAPDEMHAVIFTPDERLTTAEARAVVPREFSREDAIFNAARCALLVRAVMLRDYGALREAMDDRWHQPQRAALLPATGVLIEAAYDAGADGACLAGAGPSVLALCSRDPQTVSAAMQTAAERLAVPGTALTLRPRNFGARVEVRA
ncbi:MAG: homoserine kinase [Candidatus Dormibacteraeota bacterium]|uniref:Homoserine kinase n=1 Tax=Candidatus Aeolococcus gillhamiae TaxID=3127015 RepID=A0A934JZT1_9BACT|nr:homoserine kinase [Candidatus Dormibacteraeota bacterium]